MGYYRQLSLGLAVVIVMLLSGCMAPSRSNYQTYRAHLPKSVLVLPPLSQSLDIKAPYRYLSTVSQPLAESGYYVFPVAVVDAVLKENGLPTPGEMHTVSLSKIREVFGADAVLYVTIEEYGHTYRVVSSTTSVKSKAVLIDVQTGATLWEGRATVVQQSGESSGGLLGMVVSAAVSQIVSSVTDHAHSLAAEANDQLLRDETTGLLLGPYHPDYKKDTRGH